MTKKINILVACALSLLLLLLCAPRFTASANSAQTHWHGSDSFGAYVTDKDCPVTVESEKLTLRVPDFPSNYYSSAEEFESYAASVTAEYTFYNPAEYAVEMTLAFPFGKSPDYMYGFYDEEQHTYITFNDTDRYAITADGEEVERTVRYTLDSRAFDPQTDLARLSNSKRTGGFITPDTPVTEYRYTFSPQNATNSTCFAADFYGLGDSNKTCIMLQQFSMASYEKNKHMCGNWLSSAFSMYVIGEPLEKLPEWKMYENGSLKKEVAGSVNRSPINNTLTFNELALSFYNAESGISESDWYNAVLDMIIESREEGRLVIKSDFNSLNVTNNLMRWYEYPLSIPAGGRVVNSVTAPLYPAIDLNWQPAKFTYTYLLSPASTWADFGSFEVEVITPYYLIDGSLSFEKGEGVYTYSQQGLPDGELNFTLSESEAPQRVKMPAGKAFKYFMLYYGMPILFAVVGVGIVVAIILIIVKVVRKKKKNSNR